MSHCLPSSPPRPAAPTFQIAASSKQTQLITGPSLAVGSPCFSRTAVIFLLTLADRLTRKGYLIVCLYEEDFLAVLPLGWLRWTNYGSQVIKIGIPITLLSGA